MSNGSDVAALVVAWYRRARRDLPWRRTRDPYAIWVSEVMLQQTRVAVAAPYWERWMARFPSAAALAAAPVDDVLAAWSGLGYYGRARRLHEGAREVVARYAGAVPGDAAALRSLPGVGAYTAGAIASIAFGRPEPVVDGNVARVLARLFAIAEDVQAGATRRRLWQLAGEMVPPDAPGDFNQGLMELGATVCLPAAPRCGGCPVASACAARASGRERDLPVVRPRTADADKPLVRRAAAWIERPADRLLLLARRRPDGLFGGLWELPQADSRPALGRLFDEMGLGLALRAGPPMTRHAQVLSHRRLHILVYRASLVGSPLRDAAAAAGPYDRMAWHPLDAVGALGLAAASRSLIAAHGDDGWTTKRSPSRSSPRGTRRSSRG